MITRVIGLGNLLAGDDGVGIYVVNALRKKELPAGVELVDAGNCGVGLLSLMEGAAKIILVDAMVCGEKPGTLTTLSRQEFKLIKESKTSSSHYLSLLQALELADILEYNCEVLVLGVSPQKMDLGCCLSAQLENALPNIVEAVSNILSQ